MGSGLEYMIKLILLQIVSFMDHIRVFSITILITFRLNQPFLCPLLSPSYLRRQ